FYFAIGYAEAKLYATDICSKPYQFRVGDRRTFTASSAYGSLDACISALILDATENENTRCRRLCEVSDTIQCQEETRHYCKSMMMDHLMLADVHNHQHHKGRYKSR